MTPPPPLGSLKAAFVGIALPPGSTCDPASVPVVQWPRTSPFHGGNTGSNPVGDAKQNQQVTSSEATFSSIDPKMSNNSSSAAYTA